MEYLHIVTRRHVGLEKSKTLSVAALDDVVRNIVPALHPTQLDPELAQRWGRDEEEVEARAIPLLSRPVNRVNQRSRGECGLNAKTGARCDQYLRALEHLLSRCRRHGLNIFRPDVTRGFVGPEARLAWIEAAQLANRDAGLYGLDYRLAPRQAERPEYAQGLPLGSTVMTLTLPLLVETDLPRFLAALQTRAPGLMRVRGCRLTRLGDGPFQPSAQPHLQAECDIAWFTLAPPGGAS